MIIISRHAYADFSSATDDATRDAAFDRWGAAQDLTRATQPLVRGTRSMGGGLIPLRNARDIIDARVPDAVAPLPQGDADWLATPCVLVTGVTLVKATDATPAHTPGAAVTRSAWMLTTNDLDSFACWLSVTGGRA